MRPQIAARYILDTTGGLLHVQIQTTTAIGTALINLSTHTLFVSYGKIGACKIDVCRSFSCRRIFRLGYANAATSRCSRSTGDSVASFSTSISPFGYRSSAASTIWAICDASAFIAA